MTAALASPFAEGQESALASAVVADYTGAVRICSEHQHIPAIATALPTVSGTQIPAAWPGDRFDVIWSFTLQPGASPAEYVFSQNPQQVLAGPAAPPRSSRHPDHIATHAQIIYCRATNVPWIGSPLAMKPSCWSRSNPRGDQCRRAAARPPTCCTQRRISLSVISANHRSTRLNQDVPVGVK